MSRSPSPEHEVKADENNITPFQRQHHASITRERLTFGSSAEECSSIYGASNDAENDEYSLSGNGMLAALTDDDDTQTHIFNKTQTHEPIDDKNKVAVVEDFPMQHDVSFRMLTEGEDNVRRRLIASVEWLSGHVPEVVLYRLLDEAQTKTSYRSFGLEGSYDTEEEEADDENLIDYENIDDDVSKCSTISELSDIDNTLAAYVEKKASPSARPKPPAVSAKKAARSLGGGSFQIPGVSATCNTNGSSGRMKSLGSGLIPSPSQSGSDANESTTCAAQSQASGGPLEALLQIDKSDRKQNDDCGFEKQLIIKDDDVKAFPTVSSPPRTHARLMGFLTRQIIHHQDTHEDNLRKRLFGDTDRVSLMTSPEKEANRKLAMKAFGIRSKSSRALGIPLAATKEIVDPFPYDSDDDRNTADRNKLAQHDGVLDDEIEVQLAVTPLRKNASDRGGTEKASSSGLPFISRRECAILVIGISGFTKLSTVLELKDLPDAIKDSSFDIIVDEIRAHGGDVLKFAGDAILVEWNTLQSNPVPVDSTQSFVPSSLSECALGAAICAANLVSEHSNVHCALGVGEIVGIHIGASRSRRKYVVLGDPLKQVSEASRRAKLGEVVASPKALEILSTVCEFREEFVSRVNNEPQLIAFRKERQWQNIKVELKRTVTIGEEHLKKVVRKLKMKSLERYRQLLSFYTHPVIVADDDALFEDRAEIDCLQLQNRETNEIRSIYVFCVAPRIPVGVTGEEEPDRRLFELLNDVMNLTTRELTKCGGHLRQFIVDDMGVVIIATLGLRGSIEPNMIAEIALPATISLHNTIQNELKVDCKIGATLGEAYCGIVGGSRRREYVIMGPSAKLAARLMCHPDNPGILVSNEVQAMADKVYAFDVFTPIKAKGFAKLVPIFKPLYLLERNWGRLLPTFVGREVEIEEIVDTAEEMSEFDCASRIIFICGDAGMGKSITSVHALEHIHDMMESTHGRLAVSRRVCSDTDHLVPFGTFSNLLLDVLEFYQGHEVEISSRRTVVSMHSLDLDTLTDKIVSGEEALGRHVNRLKIICREMDAPPEFFELICQHILGLDLHAGAEAKEWKDHWTTRAQTNLIDFLARIFLRCTEECELAVLVLDDVHNIDGLSNLVLQELFLRGRNLLIICTSNEPSPDNLKQQFWSKSDCQADGRFNVKTLKRFNLVEVARLVAKVFKLQQTGGAPELVQNLMTRSGGCPQIVCAILETMKHGLPDSLGYAQMHEDISNSVVQIFVERIKSLEEFVQDLLRICAIIGTSFELPDIVSILQQTANTRGNVRKRVRKIVAALETAVEEDILSASEEVCEAEDYLQMDACSSFDSQFSSDTNRTNGNPTAPIRFAFCNSIWRSTIIDMMPNWKRRDLHRSVATSIRLRIGQSKSDFVSQTQLLVHSKAGGDKVEATNVALSLSDSYERTGLHDIAILLLDDALKMWACTDDTEDANDNQEHDGDSSKDAVASMTQENLDLLTVVDVKCQIQLLVALGRALKSTKKIRESVVAYQNALMIFSDAKSSTDLKDRSIIFPVFTALLSAITLGQIEHDEDWAFKQALIARFVQESCVHGDPIHYAWALVLQTEIHVRVGKFDRAILVQQALSEIYIPSRHTAEITAIYGADEVAQCFGRCASWYIEQNDVDAALAMCLHVSSQIMPVIERHDVHNSLMIIYPLLWVLKDNGYALDAKLLFEKYVIDAFREYHGDDYLTPCMPLYEPILMLLNLSAGIATGKHCRAYRAWALVEDSLRFGFELNHLLGHAGRCPDSISAEICLLLAKNNSRAKQKSKLTSMGLAVALETKSLVEEERMIVAEGQVMPVYQALMEMASAQDDFSSDPIEGGDHSLVFV